ncbi:hypothetical protein BLS_009082 [Venturia inaequalis]|uniref:Uncharacterized protein n=1 Tax=Venturia inaequalis TaxID=5025 RepID=A0A8H3YK91_VENIN|nr:hypothetical protein BLS_009082 [Venturia inaequalis]RDI78374.1 hypothetical protein Vi05172_g11581 [Venturia inaequalis]
MSTQGSPKITPGVGRTGGGKDIPILLVPGKSDAAKPVECQNDVTFTDHKVVVRVFKDFVVEGELVVDGSVTVHGHTEFKGTARARFILKPSTGARNVMNSTAQGTPTVILQKMVADGESYIYREGLTCFNKDKKVIINGDLVVAGNFSAHGPARFQGKRASFDGGVDYETDPIIDEQ